MQAWMDKIRLQILKYGWLKIVLIALGLILIANMLLSLLIHVFPMLPFLFFIPIVVPLLKRR